ncbi:MAG: PHP domain-containing protein [Ignavibacteria bacterium]|nr:PHP domain-containing protein [Ignavibacteria bacterium]
MILVKADVHLHTCLSPCAEITQSPLRVVQKAYEKGYNMIFITDHNTTANSKYAMRVAEKYDTLNVYPGMEITSREEVHILALFETLYDAEQLQLEINEYLPNVYFDKEKEQQIIANEFDEVEGYYEKSLFSAVDLSVEEIIDLVHKYKGAAIAAHIDRPSFSIISQLGSIPERVQFDALEVSPNLDLEKAKEIYKEYSNKYKFITGSDAHSLEQIGTVSTKFYGNSNTYSDFLKFING